jgi:hypothetical protein
LSIHPTRGDGAVAFQLVCKPKDCGSVTDAAKHVGMSRESARQLRFRTYGRAFRAAWVETPLSPLRERGWGEGARNTNYRSPKGRHGSESRDVDRVRLGRPVGRLSPSLAVAPVCFAKRSPVLGGLIRSPLVLPEQIGYDAFPEVGLGRR